MDICHPRPLLQKLSSNSKQYLYLAESLEQRYKSKAESAVGNKEQDGEYCQFASMVLCEHEGQVKKGLLDLIDSYECCVNDSTAYCTTNFNYARYEFTMLFDIWTAIRKIYDVVKHASVWDPAPRTSNDSQTNLEAVKNTIDVTLLQFICNGQLPLFKNAIEQILSCCSSQFGEEHQYYTIPPDSHIDPQAQNIAEQLDYLLDFFHDSVHRSKEGTLSVWRREAKKAMTGVGLTKNITEKELSETRPAMALRNATNEFQELAKIWMQIDRLANMFCSYRSNCSIVTCLENKLLACLQYLLQSSLVVDWRYRKLCQPHIVIRSKSRENVSIIVKILAAVESFQMTEFSEQFPSLINFRQSTITAKFIKPVNNDVALQEEIAIQLRDNVICNREYYIDRAGSITHINDAKKGELIANATMDPVDKTVGAQFDDVTFVLETGRRKLSKLERVARTKYHIDVTAKVVVNSAMTFRMGGLRTELKTLSTPFCCSVNNGQDQALYKDFLWNLLGASPDSVSCHCLPMTSTETDSSLVYWGDYREALKWLFLKLTYSRALHDDELNYLGRTLLGTNDLSASATISYQHGEPGKLGFSRIREEKTNKLASFFNWYFEAIELIMDRSDKSDRLWTEEQPKNHSTLTMGKLFESGMILGFINREDTEKLLRATGKNAMIIRFSNHFSGHVTVSYINRETDKKPEKIEHVNPLTKTLLAGIGLPTMIAMLINLSNVQHIIACRLPPGETSLPDDYLKEKDELIQKHLKVYDDGNYSEDPYRYAQIMLQIQESKTVSSTRSLRPHKSPPTSAIIRWSLEQYKDNPRVLRLLQELHAECEASNDSATSSVPSLPTFVNQSVAASNILPANASYPASNSMMPQSPPANTVQFCNLAPAPFVSSFPGNQITTGLPTSTQYHNIPMQPTGQMQSSFTPTSHNLTTFPPANGMTMMMHSQQQTTMAPNSQQMAFPVYFSSPNFAHSNDSLSSAPNCGNTTDSFYHQQNIQMGMQLLNITPVPQQQQQQLSFSFPINQNVQSHVIQNQLIQSSTMQQQQQAVMQPPMIYPTSRHLSQQQHPQQAFVIPLQQKTTRRSPQSHVNQNFQAHSPPLMEEDESDQDQNNCNYETLYQEFVPSTSKNS